MSIARIAAVLAVVGALAALVSAARGPAAPAPPELLPDLDQVKPQKVHAIVRPTPAGRRSLLVFASAVTNVGAGPMLLEGRRPSRRVAEMAVVQIVRRTDRSTRRYPTPAVMRYVRSETHAHWHVLGFERYELRKESGASVGRDRKTGFCIGDRFVVRDAEKLRGKPRRAVWRGQCGRRRPDLLRLRRGISVGFGDSYVPTLEGQFIDVTSLPAGRYVLVHRSNADRSLRESNYANNAASVLLELGPPAGARPPSVTILAECPRTARCRAS